MTGLPGRAFAAAVASACAVGIVLALIFTVGGQSSGSPSSPPTFRTVPLPPLAALARRRGIEVGVGANIGRIEHRPSYAAVVADNFTSYTEQNVLKWQFIEPAQGRFDFGQSDAAVGFARTHNMRFCGTTLVWNYQLPAWLTDHTWTRPQLLQILHQHITTVVRHYRGRIAQWVVVNEPLQPDGRGLLPSIWEKVIGPSYIRLAFRWAHEADPSAKLFLNDYGNEATGLQHFRSDYALLRLLRNQGVPVDGVGLQMHRRSATEPISVAIRAAMRAYAGLGLSVEITELDFALPLPATPDALASQAATFRSVTADCIAVLACSGVTVWGADDGDRPPEYLARRTGAATLFGIDDRPKLGYNGVGQALAFASGRPGALPLSLLLRPSVRPGSG